MGRGEASKYADIFEVLSEPEALLIADYLRENSDYVSVSDLASELRISDSKVRRYCEKLENEYIIDQDNQDGEAHYKFLSSSKARKVKYILERLT